MSRSLVQSAPLACCAVHFASLLVPGSDRRLWLAEWNAELCHLCASCGSEPAARAKAAQQALQCSLGAFPDAWCLRWNQLAPLLLSVLRPLLRPGSAARCALLLGAWTALGLLAGLALPGARKALLSAANTGSRNLLLISAAGYAGTQQPTIRLEEYRRWTTETDRLFSDIAFYRPAASRVHLEHDPTVRLSLAVASSNLLRVLGIHGDSGTLPNGEETGPRLFLSRSAWQRWYNADLHVLGRTATIAGVPVRIAGIVPDQDWPLPNPTDAWLIEDQQGFEQLPPAARGFVIARVRDTALSGHHTGWRSLIDNTAGYKSLRFDCIGVNQIVRQPLSVFLLGLLLACMALPATTALPLGDYPARRGRLSGVAHLYRWTFLALKFFLVVAAVYFCSIDVAYGFGQAHSSTAVYLQLATSFPALLFAFRWILQDQRRRCPICLRLLSNPARVGQASCNFLAWNGTELFCSRGHGLLHIPELPTSWFSRQRWLCLDPSWLSLFPGNDSAPASLI
jgi:hypothetical protein